jgi:hypothetical protein
VSKYESVDDVVRWTAGLIDNVFKHASSSEDTILEVFNIDGGDITALNRKSEEFKAFRPKLTARLVSEIDEKNRLNNKILQRLRDFHKERIKDNSVNVKEAIRDTLKELGLPTWPAKFVASDSKVTPTNFTVKPYSAWKHYKNETYDFSQPDKPSVIKAQQKFGTNIR